MQIRCWIFIESGLTFTNFLIKNKFLDNIYIFKTNISLKKNGSNNTSINIIKKIKLKNKLKINLDVVFPRISCDYLVLDAMDVSGEQHIDIEHNIYKRRLDLDGKPIEDDARTLIKNKLAAIYQ